MDVFEAVASRYSCRAFLPTLSPKQPCATFSIAWRARRNSSDFSRDLPANCRLNCEGSSWPRRGIAPKTGPGGPHVSLT